MSIHLIRDLDQLHRGLLDMCAAVEQMVHHAVDDIEDPSFEKARSLAVRDDEIDRWDVRIEELCLKTLALHQPVATDLRRIATVMKISGELERVADLGVHISERACGLIAAPFVPIPDNLRRMASLATEMLHRSIDAYVALDGQLSREICKDDEQVDELNREIIRDLKATMTESPETIEAAMHLFSISRHIERVADHATNIAEDVVYLVEGEIIRHRTMLESEVDATVSTDGADD